MGEDKNTSHNKDTTTPDHGDGGGDIEMDLKRKGKEQEAASSSSSSSSGNGSSPDEEKKAMVSLGQLFRYASPGDRFLIFLGIISAIVVGASTPIFMIVLGDFINIFSIDKLTSPNFSVADAVVDIVKWMMIIGGVASIASYAQYASWIVSCERQIRRVRQEYLRAILRQEIGWFDVTKPSELSTRIVSDTETMQEALGDKFGQLIQGLATFIGGFVVGLAKGWQLALVMIAVTPLTMISGGISSKFLAQLTKKGQDAYASAGSVAEEDFSSIRTVVMFSGEEKEVSRFERALDRALMFGRTKGWYTGGGIGIMMFILNGLFGLGLWYGGKLISDGTWNPVNSAPYTAGDVITVFFAIMMGSMSIGQAAPSSMLIIYATISCLI
eukprot:TRINITY_DN2777_c0_g1_i3.p1 TRINITY_DN2777_c0_g1~~TRINITY_DN2777_c0_g1_i3.p1  ORF type:complete len:384 (-),score=127.08 TRINITY_DN2777_c0_g1_i3:154-1305(-)